MSRRQEKKYRALKRTLDIEVNRERRKQRRVKQLALSTLRKFNPFALLGDKRCNSWNIIRPLILSQ